MNTTTTDNLIPVLSVRNLWSGYGGQPVLESVDLEIDRGDMVGIIGPNGSGKSTLIKTVLGMIKPMRGEVSILGNTGVPQREHVGLSLIHI